MSHPVKATLLLLAGILLAGCGRSPLDRSWHAKCDWNAEEYFDDPQIIEFCEAIERDDVAEVDRLIAAGVDVNALGKGNMTPLLWAYPTLKEPTAVFRRLLELGADPNIYVSSDFDAPTLRISPGDTVTHLVCRQHLQERFDAVFEHGGDPNLKCKARVGNGETPLLLVVSAGNFQKRHRIKILVDKGADLDYLCPGTDMTPAMWAVVWGPQCDIALYLLELGADWKVRRHGDQTQLIHLLVYAESKLSTPEQQKAFSDIVTWLEKQGEVYATAKSDVARWDSWSHSTGEYDREMKVEVSERTRREARAQERAGKQARPDR